MAVDFKKVKEIIVEKLNCDSGKVKEESSFEELGADSLDGVDSLWDLRRNSKLRFPMKKLRRLKLSKCHGLFRESD